MSKIGQQPILIDQAVSVSVNEKKIKIKGSVGEKEISLPDGLKAVLKDNYLIIERKKEEKKIKALHGLYRQLIANFVKGVVKPWEKRLEIVGTGYNAKLQGEDLILKLGYSHPVIYKKREGIKFEVVGNNQIVVSGIDKQLVGEVANQIRNLKKPDAYKGKGIRYLGQKIKLKPGKKAKGGLAGGVK